MFQNLPSIWFSSIRVFKSRGVDFILPELTKSSKINTRYNLLLSGYVNQWELILSGEGSQKFCLGIMNKERWIMILAKKLRPKGFNTCRVIKSRGVDTIWVFNSVGFDIISPGHELTECSTINPRYNLVLSTPWSYFSQGLKIKGIWFYPGI